MVLLLLFGAKRIPDIARAVGKSMSQFKKGLKDIDIESDEIGRKDENKEQSEE